MTVSRDVQKQDAAANDGRAARALMSLSELRDACVETLQVFFAALAVVIALAFLGGDSNKWSSVLAEIGHALQGHATEMRLSFVSLALIAACVPLLFVSKRPFGKWFKTFAERVLHFLGHIVIGALALGIPQIYQKVHSWADAAGYVFVCVLWLITGACIVALSKGLAEDIEFRSDRQLLMCRFVSVGFLAVFIFTLPRVHQVPLI